MTIWNAYLICSDWVSLCRAKRNNDQTNASQFELILIVFA